MKRKALWSGNNALAGVIEALLLVALVSIVLSVIQLQYVPQVMDQREAEHMDEVSNQFSTMKSMIDLQGITNSSAPIFSMLTLGSRELPYFVTVGSFGEIFVVDDNQYKIETVPSLFKFPSGVPLTAIEYAADNIYFVDQIYSLECGGIIVKQPSGSPVMRVDPSIRVVNRTNDLDIYWNIPILVGVEGQDYTSGNGKCFIRTNWSRTESEQNPDILLFRITTKYPHAWHALFSSLLGEQVLYDVGDTYVEISAKIKDLNLFLTYQYFYVQIGIGWVK